MEVNLGLFRGVVFRYDVKKGFGFIEVTHKESGNGFSVYTSKLDQVFVHHRAIEPDKDGFKKLMQDQVVEFTIFKRDRGLAASNLKIIGDAILMDDFKRFSYLLPDEKKAELSNENLDSYYNKEEFNKWALKRI